MAKNIIGNNDGANGGNDTYNIPGRGTNIPRSTIINEVQQGKHPDFHLYAINGETYISGNPDGNSNNNVNR